MYQVETTIGKNHILLLKGPVIDQLRQFAILVGLNDFGLYDFNFRLHHVWIKFNVCKQQRKTPSEKGLGKRFGLNLFYCEPGSSI
jgi:hypothetical protein